MNEKQWAESIKEYLSSVFLSDNVKIDTLIKLPYAKEILDYKNNFEPMNESLMDFETDLLVYEKTDGLIKPRIIIEMKLSSVTTHDAIIYSYKAQNHKTITPFLRYGIIIGSRKHYPLPGRLFRHGINFDFMISFQKEKLSPTEKNAFEDIIKKELNYSRQLEEMFFNSRSKSRKHYFVLHKELSLKEID